MSVVMELVSKEAYSVIGDLSSARTAEKTSEREAEDHSTCSDQVSDRFSLRPSVTSHSEVASVRIYTGLLVEAEEPISLILEPSKVGSPVQPELGGHSGFL
jgi:hypothetical protein